MPGSMSMRPRWYFVRALVACVLVLLVPGAVAAQPAEEPGAVADQAAGPGDDRAAQEPADARWVPAGERELGARLGLAMGGRTTPGGLRMAGVLLYRLSEDDWFEGSLGFTFGSRNSACATGPDGGFACHHGAARGAAAEVVAGVRRFISPRPQLAPYLRAGIGLRLVRFADDEVDGVAIPLVVGGGIRTRLGNLISVGGDAALETGLGVFDRGLGIEPQLGLSVQAVIEFWLD